MLIADPEKAVVDYLYFVSQGKRELNDRMDLSKLDKGKVFVFAAAFDNKKLNSLINKVFK
jgi:hypothetical protein